MEWITPERGAALVHRKRSRRLSAEDERQRTAEGELQLRLAPENLRVFRLLQPKRRHRN